MTTAAELTALARRVRCLAGEEPFELAVVLGSGWSALLNEAKDGTAISYAELPGFPPVTVAGHAGSLVAGELQGWRVLLFGGRFHLYEGISIDQTVLPVRLAHALGCRRLLLTNAAGGINPGFRPGDFMFIADHLNLLGANPLRGWESPFLDLSRLYRRALLPPLRARLDDPLLRLHEGVLAAVPGPTYETPAEVRMLARLGADAVSMSTIPEAIMGKYLGMEVAGLSLISNHAAGLATEPLDHREVLTAGYRGAAAFVRLVRLLLTVWREEPPE
jgi:purine-nucleoside phosphorylase